MNFRDRVYALTRRVPAGMVTTYRALADALGNPKLARAVGNALNKNTDFKNIPCHRVVRSDGRAGGYALGVRAKEKKLRSEGVVTKKGRVVDLPARLFYYIE